MSITRAEKKKFMFKGAEQVEEGLPGWYGTFADMMKIVHQGSLHGIVDRTFPLNAVSEAHMVMESREFLCKLVIRINYWIHWLIENK